MSKSLPSKEIFCVDVPIVSDVQASFKYNFFVPDEQVNETGGIPTRFLQRVSADDDMSYTSYIETRIPRYIKISWMRSTLKDPGNALTESDINEKSHRPSKRSGPNIITENYDKIIDEDFFSSFNYMGVTYHDGEIDKKLSTLVSGTYEQISLNEPHHTQLTPSKVADFLNSKLPGRIDSKLIQKGITTSSQYGIKFYSTDDSSTSNRQPVTSLYMDRLKRVYVHSIVNSKLFHDITGRNIRDPHSPYTQELSSLYKTTKKISLSLISRSGNTINDEEYKTIVPYINLSVNSTFGQVQRKSAEIVGYVIDKFEIASNGEMKQLQPLIVENASASSALDVRVKYNAQYMYIVRTIVSFKLPAIDDETNEIATIQILVSSKPSNPIYAHIHDDVAPPPPTDVEFTWNYETEKLLVHWTFPPNSQRDIKRFQVFRRIDINHPFELLKEYDFDDSVTTSPFFERPAQNLVEQLHNNSPVTFYVDDDFKKDSTYIYAVCSIDAHGLTSNYSAQFKLGFDIFKNQLKKSLTSHSGAPKQYPNIYLEGEGFVNVARVNGSHSKDMRLYFVPQYYMLEDDNGRQQRILSTKQTHGMYRFQFINVDNQKMQTLNVTINDQIQAAQPKTKRPGQQTRIIAARSK